MDQGEVRGVARGKPQSSRTLRATQALPPLVTRLFLLATRH
jgi:hypothetical protein